MRRPSLFRHLSAVLSSALLLQLSLLASGTLCPMHGGNSMAVEPAHASHAHMSHAGRSLNGTRPAHSTMSGATDARGAPESQRGCDTNGTSCDTPWSPSGCASMSACAMSLSALTQPALPIAAPTAVRVASLSGASLPLGPSYAPELPPPRA